jgi:phospholipid/cholesterol/gamma-HCH transport system substrate-binding protein
MKKDKGYVWKLGMFVILGLATFVFAIYYVGKNQNMFSNTFKLKTQFKTVSGLKVGNNVRFVGINIGTVSNIEIQSDTSVMVYVIIKKDLQKFINTSATASIGSDGLMGDKVFTISPSVNMESMAKSNVKDGDFLLSKNPIEMEDVMVSVKNSVDNANIITAQLAMFSYKMNNNDGVLSKLLSDKDFSNSVKNTLDNLQNSSGEFSKFTTKMNSGKGTLGKLMNDDKLSKKLDSTMSNLQTSSKGLSENMEAAKSSFLLRGAFKKMKKVEAKKIADSLKLLKKQKAITN